MSVDVVNTYSASVIKSTSRFAPKAVPRKQQVAAPVQPKPATVSATVDEDIESEDEIEEAEEDRAGLINGSTQLTGAKFTVHGSDKIVGQRIDIPTIQSSIPLTIRSTVIPAPSTRSLRSQRPVSDSNPTDTISTATSSSSCKRCAPADSSRRTRQKVPLQLLKMLSSRLQPRKCQKCAWINGQAGNQVVKPNSEKQSVNVNV
jgi:hypothetical protein